MELNGFKISKYNVYGFKEGTKTSTCPLCSHTRKKNKDKCLTLDWDRGLGKCWHCEQIIQLHEYEKKKEIEVVETHYKKPNTLLFRELKTSHREYLNSRGITDKVIDSNNLKTTFSNIVFTYYLGGEVVNVKQRNVKVNNYKDESSHDKSFRQNSGSRQTMYRLDNIVSSIARQKQKKEPVKIIIGEGELDALSWEVAGCDFATSVSQGAPTPQSTTVEKKIACIYNDLDILKEADIIYLSCDKDPAGERLQKELIKIFQQLTTVMILDNGNFKDANEVLINEGVKSLHNIYNEATEAPQIKMELPEFEEKPEAVRFPVEAFPEFVIELMNHLGDVKNYENSFMGISLLGVIGTVAGARVCFDSGQYINRALIMGTMVAPPSVNKSAPMRDFIKPLDLINNKLRKQYNQDLEEFEINEELPKNSSIKDNNLKKPLQKQIVYGNTTVEAVHGMHTNNKDGLLCKADELRTWFDSLGQYKSGGKGGDIGLYLENFNGSDYVINRVGRSLYIELLHINIIGGIQPDKLASFPTDNGFLQRFIFALPEKEPCLRSRKFVNKSFLDNYNNYIINSYEFFRNLDDEATFTLTDGAVDVFYDYLDELRLKEIDKEISLVYSQFLGKLTITFHRLCLIMRIMDHVFEVLDISESLEIGIEHVENAILLTEYFIKTAESVIDSKANTRELQRVGYGKGETNKQLILRMYKAGTKPVNIANFIGISRSHVYRVIRDSEKIKH